MEKLTNRVQVLLDERKTTLTRWWMSSDLGVSEEEWKAATREQHEQWKKEATERKLLEIRVEINRIAKKLVEATEGNLEFDLAAGRLTDFCDK
jgi:hypothetical protein